MQLQEKIVVDKIEIVGGFKHMHVRTTTIILKDGIEIARSHHRKVLSPGDNFNEESEDVKKICNILYAPELIDDYKKMIKK